MAHPNAMVVSMSRVVQQGMASVLGDCGLSTVVASTIEEARALLGRHAFSLICCSDELPGVSVEDFIRNISLPPKKVPVVVALGVGEWESCLHFLNLGAFDCFVYPPSVAEFKRVTQNALGIAPQKVQRKFHRQAAGAA